MKRIRSRTAEKKWRHPFSNYKPMGIFSDIQGQLTLQSVVQSGRNSNSSKLSCTSSLPASMKTDEKQPRKSGDTVFSIITLSVPWKPAVGSGRISNSSKLSCMLSLPASMKRIQSKKAEKKWRHCCSHYKPMGIFQTLKGSLHRSRWSNQAEIQTCRSSHVCHHCLQV